MKIAGSVNGFVTFGIGRVKSERCIAEFFAEDMIKAMAPHLPPASIVVPTFREAPNIRPLTERVFSALAAANHEAELIFVDDDSRDGTEEIVEALRATWPVRLVVRRGERGLSGAVLAGFEAARYDLFVVLDADLQHPPERIPAMLERFEQDDCEFVIGTRYGGGAISQHWPLLRRLGSRAATLLARPLAPLSDPMSGFFAIRRCVWERAEGLDPIGYKIALELFVKARCRRAAEVPIQFAARTAGESKAGAAEMVRYLRHLIRLYRFRYSWMKTPSVLLLIAAAGFLGAMLAMRLFLSG